MSVEGHTHNYQPVGSYAAADHSHDSIYAALNHSHTGVYQPIGSYAPFSHTHTKNQITDFPNIPDLPNFKFETRRYPQYIGISTTFLPLFFYAIWHDGYTARATIFVGYKTSKTKTNDNDAYRIWARNLGMPAQYNITYMQYGAGAFTWTNTGIEVQGNMIGSESGSISYSIAIG